MVHGPHPHGYAQRTPKKMIAAALRGALSDRARDGRIYVVADLVPGDVPSTRTALAALSGITTTDKVLVVIHRDEDLVWLSLRNAATVHAIAVDQLNAYDVLVNDEVVFTSAALAAYVAGRTSGGSAKAVATESEADLLIEPAERRTSALSLSKCPLRPSVLAEPVEGESELVEAPSSPTNSPPPRSRNRSSRRTRNSPRRRIRSRHSPRRPAPGGARARRGRPRTTRLRSSITAPSPTAARSRRMAIEVKGNEDSMKFHTPESPYYTRTIAEVWFTSAEAAEAAGFENVQGDTGAEDEEDEDK